MLSLSRFFILFLEENDCTIVRTNTFDISNQRLLSRGKDTFLITSSKYFRSNAKVEGCNSACVKQHMESKGEQYLLDIKELDLGVVEQGKGCRSLNYLKNLINT